MGLFFEDDNKPKGNISQSANDVFTKVFEFEREIGYKINVGDKVRLWLRPDSDLVYAYGPGSVGGTGRVGIYEEHGALFYNHLSANLKYSAKVLEFDDDYVTIIVDFYGNPNLGYQTAPIKEGSFLKNCLIWFIGLIIIGQLLKALST